MSNVEAVIHELQQRELFESWLTQTYHPLPDFALQRQIKSYDKYSTPVTQSESRQESHEINFNLPRCCSL